MRSRPRRPSPARSDGDSDRIRAAASAIAALSRGGQTAPASPTSQRLSPTSVTTAGTPEASASATASGIDSPQAEDRT